ncbi:MAG: hypothetical protein ICV51_20845 [Flavisolibacter sp.]|nr:hypothetical protein [Flavisolibacter sp.]
MEHLLFAGYLILFAWLVTKINFFTRSGLTAAQLIILFLLKVMAGIFYGWIGVYYGEMAQMMDTWAYHYASIQEAHLLQQNPQQFFTGLFQNDYHDYGRFLSSENSWWNDLHSNFLIKIFALFQLLSFGNYYINVIFYSFITLFGPIAVYRIMILEFPAKKIVVLLATFLVPSFLYWTSGIHKDGLIFLGLALITFHFYFGLRKGFTWYGIVTIMLGLLVILVLRNYLLLILVPALIAWWLAEQLRFKPLLTFGVVYASFIFLFFSARHIHSGLDFPKAVVEKQQAFLKLKGGSFVPVREIEPNVLSFIINAPQALSLTVLRPYPSDVKHLLSLAAAVEVVLLLLLFLTFLVFFRHYGAPIDPFLLFCLFFSLSVLLTIGYTVNFLGAIVRYRSIILPFLVVPLAAHIDWNRIGAIFLGEIKTKDNI